MDMTSVKGAFDMAFSPPELLLDPSDFDPDDFADIEYWALNTSFEVEQQNDSSDVKAKAFVKDEFVGEVLVTLEVQRRKTVPRIQATAASDQTADAMGHVAEHCRKSGWLKIWYTSGHTFIDEQVFASKFREFQFDDISWDQFKDIDIHQEKPDPDKEIGGENDFSLFSWLQRCWPNIDGKSDDLGGWLACDDGSGEMADFVHFDETERLLSLIHIKASHSKSTNPEVSVSDYEVVTAQALKNLMFLDNEIAATNLRSGIEKKKIADKVWHNRQKSTREELLNFLESIGSDYRRRIVVVQPRLTKTLSEFARSNPESAQAFRMRQLNTLLLAASASARTVGSDFRVIAHDA